MHSSSAGPDLVLAGAARSGTSALAAQLGAHPDIDPGKIKESNYFSRNLSRGPDWYEGLYGPRSSGTLRLDASTSYTSPKYPAALDRLLDASPDVFVIYAVRRPTERAVSHYLLRRHYFEIEPAESFGDALSHSNFYTETGDYSKWIPALHERLPTDQVLVVPFEVITERAREATSQICRQVSLSDPPETGRHAHRHRNDVVQYRNATARKAAKVVRQSAVYPWLRNTLGPGRTRKLRGIITREAQLPTAAESLATCSPAQLEMLRDLDARAGNSVSEQLARQDARSGLSWCEHSFAFQDVTG